VLIVGEVALAVTLLACSALIVRSFLKLSGVEPGFDPQHTAFVRVAMTGTNYANPEQQIAFTAALLSRIQNAAGVEAAGTTNYFPLGGTYRSLNRFEVEGRPSVAITERPLAHLFSVSPDYFRATGIPLRQGRVFSDRDDAKSSRVAIINQTLARQHFRNQDPVGKRLMISNTPDDWRIIVGVVGDVSQVDVGEAPSAQIYEPCAQKGDFGFVVVRGPGNPALLPGIIKRELQALDPNLPVGDVNTAAEFMRNKLTIRRLMLQLLTTFTAIGLFVAAIGIYGVIAFSVNQRTVEIGIRMALGAQKRDVLALVMRQGAWIVGIGFGIGPVATFIAGRAIQSQLYNTSGNDPVSLAGVTLFFAAVAALACWLPARRAMKVDPIVALRAE
jgi:putative ABC transport system permease protein